MLLVLSGLISELNTADSVLSVPPLITVAVLLKRSFLSGGDLASCTLTRRLRGHGDSGILTASRDMEKLRLNSRRRAGVVVTTRDVRKGRLANMMRRVIS